MLLKKLIQIIELCKKKEIDNAKKLINTFKPFLNNNFEASIIDYSIKSLENKKNYLLKNCKDIIDLKPEISFSYINIGNYYKNSKNYEKARLFYLKSLKKNKEYFNLYSKYKSLLSLITLTKKKSEYSNYSHLSEALYKKFLKIILIINLKQLITFSRPHFSSFYTASEIFLKKVNYFIKNEKKFFLKSDIIKLEKILKNYSKIFEINPDYDNPYFNLAYCSEKLKHYKKAIKFYKQANLFENSKRYDQNILKIYYKVRDKKNFIKLSKKFHKQKKYNFTAFAITNFASKQLNVKNYYEFCNNPTEKIFVENLITTKKIKKSFLTKLEKDIKKNLHSTATPVVVGLKSLGNLLHINTKSIKDFKKLLFSYLKKYKNIHDKNSIIFAKWPQKFNVNAWYIRLYQGGEVGSHIHHGWVSGVFYVKKKYSDKKGDLEITEKYGDLIGKKNKINSVKLPTKPGDLVLFPSSLPHRVIPFQRKSERISIAFDMFPTQLN